MKLAKLVQLKLLLKKIIMEENTIC